MELEQWRRLKIGDTLEFIPAGTKYTVFDIYADGDTKVENIDKKSILKISMQELLRSWRVTK